MQFVNLTIQRSECLKNIEYNNIEIQEYNLLDRLLFDCYRLFLVKKKLKTDCSINHRHTTVSTHSTYILVIFKNLSMLMNPAQDVENNFNSRKFDAGVMFFSTNVFRYIFLFLFYQEKIILPYLFRYRFGWLQYANTKKKQNRKKKKANCSLLEEQTNAIN